MTPRSLVHGGRAGLLDSPADQPGEDMALPGAWFPHAGSTSFTIDLPLHVASPGIVAAFWRTVVRAYNIGGSVWKCAESA